MKKQLLFVTVLFLSISSIFAQNVPNYVPTNGLVGWWPFNGNANDESGNGNHGTVNGAALTADRIGKANNAYKFNGAEKIVIQNTILTNDFTDQSTSVWINTKVGATTIMSDRGKNGGYPGYFWYKNSLFVDSIGDWRSVSHNNNCVNESYSKSNSSVIDGNWHHLLIVWDSKNNLIKLYTDGVLTKTNTSINKNCYGNVGQPLTIGCFPGYPGISDLSFYNGLIDDIAIYNRALSEQEITNLYNGGSQSTIASTKVFVDAPASVKQNDTLQLSISTETLNTSDNVIAYQTDFSYDTTRYTYLSNNLVGTLNTNGSVVVNSTKNGKLSISYMSQTALNGAGSLMKLKFKSNNTLGQGIFGLSNFLYNTTTITSLKSDTVVTIDGIPPTAKITYSVNPARKGDSLLITVKFNEKMAVSPVPQLNLTGQNTLANSNLTKVNDTTYTYWWVVEKGNGAVNVNLATGKDLGGNGIVATPTQNPSFTVLPTLFGDIDTNKSVQAYDAALALQYSVGLNPLPTMDPLPWSNWRLAVANVDTVGNVTANDASLILQYSAKLISTFPADAKKRGGDAPTADVTVSKEGNQLVFRTTGTLYGFNVYFKENFNAFGQPEVSDKNVILATNINATTYNLGLASTKPITVNEPFLIIPILTNTDVKGTMDIVANTQEKSLAYGAALSILEINKEMLIVYPNPTKDIVTIKNAQGNTLRILNVEGKEVYNQKMTGNTMDVSLKTVGAKGMYILHIQDANNESIQSKQIILE